MLKFLILFVITGCSGYRFSQQENPLSQYGIQSLSVPMFYNYSNLSEVHTDFTRETYRLLTGFSGLKLNNGYNKNSDAVLIGILKSPEKVAETLPEPLESSNIEARYEGKLYDLASVELPPEFQGGQAALGRYLGSRLRYPAGARQNKIQGKVYIGFIVEKNGSLADFKVVRGIGAGCDEEAIRVLKSSPAWRPGMANNKPVRTSYVLPITFMLGN